MYTVMSSSVLKPLFFKLHSIHSRILKLFRTQLTWADMFGIFENLMPRALKESHHLSLWLSASSIKAFALYPAASEKQIMEDLSVLTIMPMACAFLKR